MSGNLCQEKQVRNNFSDYQPLWGGRYNSSIIRYLLAENLQDLIGSEKFPNQMAEVLGIAIDIDVLKEDLVKGKAKP